HLRKKTRAAPVTSHPCARPCPTGSSAAHAGDGRERPCDGPSARTPARSPEATRLATSACEPTCRTRGLKPALRQMARIWLYEPGPRDRAWRTNGSPAGIASPRRLWRLSRWPDGRAGSMRARGLRSVLLVALLVALLGDEPKDRPARTKVTL